MELIASPILSEEDVEAIANGYSSRAEREEQALSRQLTAEMPRLVRERLGILAWLIEFRRLDVKIAVHRGSQGTGLYHEKLGVFTDGRDVVAFTGSPNESASGLVSNFEAIEVYCSWREHDRERAMEKVRDFVDLWENRTPPLEVVDFPVAVKRKLVSFRQASPPDCEPDTAFEPPEYYEASSSTGIPRASAGLRLRAYQEQAVRNWFRANGRGVLKMATGSGKTITALSILERLHQRAALDAAIIVVPYRHLVTQWANETKKFGLESILCFGSRAQWMGKLQDALLVAMKTRRVITAIVTNATFMSPAFQELVKHFPSKTLLIADEAHNLGAPRLAAALPSTLSMRLALSATPERWFDERGTEVLFRYFGDVLEPQFTVRDALNAGALVPYVYNPVLVSLTPDETDLYRDLSQRISRVWAVTSGDTQDNGPLNALLIKRARLLGSASNKTTALKDIMARRRDTSHTLFYCGDGSVEEPASHETERQVDAVCRMLGSELGYRVDTYTAENTLDERNDLRERFVSGELQGLVAIRCLDEGVDIPAIRSAFILASSSNPRQFIQRRGRVLRPAPGKEYAEIYDFVVIPPLTEDEVEAWERELLRKELTRYIEFADLAMNAGEARGMVVELQQRFGLLSL